MKKVLILAAIMLFCAASAFAGGSVDLDLTKAGTGLTLYGSASASGGAAGGAAIGRTSTGVGVAVFVDTVSGNGYALATQHMSGTKAFGTAYDSTALFVTIGDVEPGTVAFTGGALSATDTTDFTSWKTM